ncbi:SAM-dependent methyltransferase [Lujinxingia litoralis]|nr:class I SAM-dependent methyltransferase [Lujinxingia litoralis]
MNSDYYDELAGALEPAQRSGWRHRLEQWLRFELTCAALRPTSADRLIDLGCGPAALAAYLPKAERPAYLGVERHPELAAQARGTLAGLEGSHVLLECDLFDERVDRAGPFELSVAIGALVDGQGASEAQRARRALDHLRRVFSLGAQGTVLFVLDQAALNANPHRALEPALMGCFEHEIMQIADELGLSDVRASPVLAGEWMIVAGPRPRRFDPMKAREACVSAVLRRWHRSAGVDPADAAWLWWVVGDREQAQVALAALETGHPRRALLQERIALL